MSFGAILALCAQALLIQAVVGQNMYFGPGTVSNNRHVKNNIHLGGSDFPSDNDNGLYGLSGLNGGDINVGGPGTGSSSASSQSGVSSASGAYVSGNTVVDNDYYITGGFGGVSGAGLGSGIGLGAGVSSGLGVSGGIGLGAGLSSGLGYSSGLGLGLGSGLSVGVGSGAVLGGASGLTVASSPLIVTSISPIGPSGLAVASENVIEGVLTVNGQLPFLSAVAFEGPLPTSGSGVATCGCGNGQVGITSEGLSRPGLYY